MCVPASNTQTCHFRLVVFTFSLSKKPATPRKHMGVAVFFSLKKKLADENARNFDDRRVVRLAVKLLFVGLPCKVIFFGRCGFAGDREDG